MNEAQRQYLKLLCDEAGERFDPGLDEASAERRIGELRIKTGRGVHEHAADVPAVQQPARSQRKHSQREDVFPPPQSRG